jgi:choice-of-anchor B domain-containing protein
MLLMPVLTLALAGAATPPAIAARPGAASPAPVAKHEQGDPDGPTDPGEIPDAHPPARCAFGKAGPYPCRDVDLLSFVPLDAIGWEPGQHGTDVWGWHDPETGREYALLAHTHGTAFLDVTDPERPVYLGLLPTHTQPGQMRDVKTYGPYAYVAADLVTGHGIQVFDLRTLRGVHNPPVTFAAHGHYGGVDRTHNIAIESETGLAVLLGSGDRTCRSAYHMVSLADPLAPTYLGCHTPQPYSYVHDAQCVIYRGPDGDHLGRRLCFGANTNALQVVDVTDPTAAREI